MEEGGGGGPLAEDGGAAAERRSSSPPSKSSLYVGDLDPAVGEEELRCAFTACGRVASVRVCRDCRTGASLRYAYVNFLCRSDAENALRTLNHTALRGRPIRIMWSQRNPRSRKTGEANLFVKNLDSSVDGAKLEEMFSKYGTVSSCKVATEENGQSKHFGFVQFEKEESAEAAIKALNGAAGHGVKKLYVGKFVRRSERLPPNVPRLSNLCMKSLENSFPDDILLKESCGSREVRKIGRSKVFEFASFESPEHTSKAIEVVNGAKFGTKSTYVGKDVWRNEPVKLLGQNSTGYNASFRKMDKSKVYVKNLHAYIDDGRLREIFTGCGRIISANVIRDVHGVSRGFGFVRFSSAAEAENAVVTFNGTMVLGERLSVAISHPKIVRHGALRSLPAKIQPTVTTEPQNRIRLVYPQQTPIKQQYGLTNSVIHTGRLPASLGFRYQLTYGNSSWLSAFPYYVDNTHYSPFASQWYQPVNAVGDDLWMRALQCYAPEMSMRWST